MKKILILLIVSFTPFLIFSSDNIVALQNQSSTLNVKSESDFNNSIVEYTYEDGIIYSVYSSPIIVTDIRLETNEVIESPIAVGDPTHWNIETITSSSSVGDTVHVLVKSIRDYGETSIIVATNLRCYYFRLIATKENAMVGCRFIYPSNKTLKTEHTKIPNKEDNSEIINLFFDYEIIGDYSWTPYIIYSDSKFTYFKFPKSLKDNIVSPVVYIKNENSTYLVNYTVYDDVYKIAAKINIDNSFLLIFENESCEVKLQNDKN